MLPGGLSGNRLADGDPKLGGRAAIAERDLDQARATDEPDQRSLGNRFEHRILAPDNSAPPDGQSELVCELLSAEVGNQRAE